MKRESKIQNIALFGGSFNPPTIGHQAVIAECLKDAMFDEIWIMPSKDRRDKHMGGISPSHRLQMIEQMREGAFAGDSRVIVSDFELCLADSLTETAVTMTALCAQYPDRTFWNIYGVDSYNSMPTWNNGETLQKELNICVVNRGNTPLPTEIRPNLRTILVASEFEEISSTMVRSAVAAQADITRMVCSGVAQFIKEERLFLS